VQIDQSSDAKPYAVLALSIALLVSAVLRDRRIGSAGSFAALLAAGVAAASVHFYGGAAAGAIAAAAILASAGRRDRVRAAVLLVTVLGTSAVWLAGAVRLDRGAADYLREMWGRVPLWAPFAASTRVALPGWRKPYPTMDGRVLPFVQAREVAGVAVVIATALGALFAGRGKSREPVPRAGGRFVGLVAVALWPGFLALEVALAAIDRPIAIVGRSEVIVEIGVAILIGFAVSRWRHPFLPIAALAAVGLWTVVPQWRPRPGPQGRRWEEAIVRRLLATTRPGSHADVVTLGLARPPFDYYAGGDSRLRLRSFPESQNSHPGWAAHSVSAADRASLPAEADRLIAFVDGELDRGVRVYLAAREDPRNAWLLAPLRRDHDVRPVPWGPGWFLEVVRAPLLTAADDPESDADAPRRSSHVARREIPSGPRCRARLDRRIFEGRRIRREPFSRSGVWNGQGGPTCDDAYAWRSSSGFSQRQPPSFTRRPTAASLSRSWSAAARRVNTPRAEPSTSRRFAAFPTLFVSRTRARSAWRWRSPSTA
ncbi:MAG TPA: hypothetical protein VFS34_16660, partial [Thermoanaerobaculia bacterium]|nr:hypothetical protein [Thermoanaerobaculia bacterium]